VLSNGVYNAFKYSLVSVEFNKQKEVSSFSCSKNKCKRKYFLLRRQWVLLLPSAILSSPSSLHLLPSAWASRDSSRRISTIELNIVTIFSSMHIVNWNIFCWAWWWRSTTNHKDLLRKKQAIYAMLAYLVFIISV